MAHQDSGCIYASLLSSCESKAAELFRGVGSSSPLVVMTTAKGDDDEGKAGGDDKKAGKPEVSEITMTVGLQFGLTDATSDAALKLQAHLSSEPASEASAA
jgi:hypothetical protein